MEAEKVKRFRTMIKIARSWRRFRDLFAASLDVNTERKVQLYVQLSKSATLRDVVYWLQIIFSAGIATLGLVLNSSAVIIGAMLISPLMGPILSAGLALASGDLILAFRSGTNIFLSILAAVSFAVVLVAALPFKNETAEIMARTSPNTLDLVVALFSGAIGSIATCREVKGVVTSIPGVAIAVALMPPLCVVGYGVGVAVSLNPADGLSIAGGGGLLFLTNLVAITFMAMLVFIFLRVDTSNVREKVDLWKSTDRENLFWRKLVSNFPTLEKARQIRSFSLRLLMILLPLLLIFIPLSQSYSRLRDEIVQKQAENQMTGAARTVWNRDYAKDSEGNVRSYLDELRIEQDGENIRIFMRVFDNIGYTQEERDEYIRRVARSLNRDPETISLQLIEIPTSARDKFTPVIEATPTPLTVAQTQATYLQEINNSVQQLSLPDPALLIDYSINLSPGRNTNFQINYLSPRDIEKDGKDMLLKELARRLNIQNLSVSYLRISSEVRQIEFKRNTAELQEESVALLESAASDLQMHPSLRVRAVIAGVKDDKAVSDARVAEVRRIFTEQFAIDEQRLALDVVEEGEVRNTFQVFLRK